MFFNKFLAFFSIINCHKAKLLNLVNSGGIESLSKNTSPGFAPFLVSEYFKTKIFNLIFYFRRIPSLNF